VLYPPNPPGNVNNFPAQITLPDDGTDLKAADVNVALEALADRTAYLKTHTVLGVYTFIFDEEDVIYQKIFSGTNYASPTAPDLTVNVPNAQAGDLILVDANFGLLLLDGGAGSVRLVAIDNALGGGSAAPILGGRFVHNVDGSRLPCTLVGTWVVVASGTTRIQVQGKVLSAPTKVIVERIVSIRVTHVRLP
jgi:hypothetical protein